MERIRIGIVGAGGNTRLKHIPGFQAIPGVDIVTVCNRSRESSQRVADEFGIPRIAENWVQVVEDPDVDAVMIGTWPYLHAPISIAALKAGKHVLCEARMAMNAHEAREMLETSITNPELTAQVVPSPFTLKWDRFIRQRLDQGLIGRVLAVDVFANAGSFMDSGREMTWREDIAYSGLNTMALGIYYEAMARWVGHAATVHAHGRAFVGSRVDSTGTRRACQIPDHLDVFGELCDDEGCYHIRCSQVTGACPTPNDFILYGETGTLRLDIQNQKLSLTLPDGGVQVLEVPKAEQEDWRVEAEFIGAIRGQEAVRLTSFREGVRYMEFTQKVADDLEFAPSAIRNAT